MVLKNCLPGEDGKSIFGESRFGLSDVGAIGKYIGSGQNGGQNVTKCLKYGVV